MKNNEYVSVQNAAYLFMREWLQDVAKLDMSAFDRGAPALSLEWRSDGYGETEDIAGNITLALPFTLRYKIDAREKECGIEALSRVCAALREIYNGKAGGYIIYRVYQTGGFAEGEYSAAADTSVLRVGMLAIITGCRYPPT